MADVAAADAAARRYSARAYLVRALAPVTVLAGLAWAVAQPYRLTLLDPAAHGFWSLVVEPPLLVIAAGVAFRLLVVPGLLEDLERDDDAAA